MAGSQPKAGPSGGLLLTLDRGLRVLEAIADEQGRSSAKSLSNDLGINLGTCYQLLRTLQANGYVHRRPGGQYGLGPRIGFLAGYYEEAVAPPPELIDILHELRDALAETVYVSIRRRDALPIAGVLEGTKMLRVGNLGVGFSAHPHIRASAKAYLAHLDPEEVEDFFETKEFEALTPNTITTWEGFLDELAATRKRGYGIDNEEYVEGVTCLGAVVFDGAGRPFGALGTSFPATRFHSEGAEMAAELLAAAEKASRSLGFDGEYREAAG